NSGGTFNASLTVYIGGGSTQANAQVTIDLSGATNAVDSTSLGINADKVDTKANALTAITDIGTAITNLGKVQGAVGTGQNDLQYAVSLAQSQIASFSAADSRIRDADIASEASNLTKAQTLQQASLAALAQANAAPQAVLALFK